MSDIRKITFDNKVDSLNFNLNSKYVLTADNINEIKTVVNNLSDEILEKGKFADFFRFLRFNLNSELKENTFYSLKIQISNLPTFSNSIEVSCFPTIIPGQQNYEIEEDNNTNKFCILKNGEFKFYKNLIFTSNDENSEVIIDIYDYLKVINDKNLLPFFGRYKLINLTENIEYDWNGFTLSFSSYDQIKSSSKDFIKIEINGKNELIGHSTNSYQIFGIKQNGSKIDITSNSTLSLLNNDSNFLISSNTITVLNTLKNESNLLIIDSLYNNIKYTTYLPISIIPQKIIKVEINGSDKISELETKEYTIQGIFLDGSIKDITNSVNASIESRYCSISKENGKIKITCNDNIYNDEICLLIVKIEDQDTDIIYGNSKPILIKKKIFNSFIINLSEEHEIVGQDVILNHSVSDLFSFGSLYDGHEYYEIYFKIYITGPDLINKDKTKDVNIYEIGTSFLNIETIEEGDYFNKTYTKKISIKSIEDLNKLKSNTKILLAFSYNDDGAGNLILKSYTVGLYQRINGIEYIKIELGRDDSLFYGNESCQYYVYGVTFLGDIIDITNESTISLNVPYLNATIDTENHRLNIESLSINAIAGYLKASYNDLITYKEIYFKQNS